MNEAIWTLLGHLCEWPGGPAHCSTQQSDRPKVFQEPPPKLSSPVGRLT